MHARRFVLVVLILTGGCSGGGATQPSPVSNTVPAAPPDAAPDAPQSRIAAAAAAAQMRMFRDEMCRCTEKVCTERVMNDMTRFAEEMGVRDDPRKPSDAEIKEMTEMGQQFAECMTKALTATP